MFRQVILASNRYPAKGSGKTGFFKVDSAGKRRLLYDCHLYDKQTLLIYLADRLVMTYLVMVPLAMIIVVKIRDK